MYPSLCRNDIASRQCSGYVTFWYESRSADPYLGLKEPDTDPALVVCNLSDANKQLCCCLLLFEGTFKLTSKMKVITMSRNSKIKFFLLFFLYERRIPIRTSKYRIREAQKLTRNTASTLD
jgi:hypothetical protein